MWAEYYQEVSVMDEKDFNVFNVPLMLSRVVEKRDENGTWVRDESWYENIRKIYFSLFEFLQGEGLLHRSLVASLPDVDSVVVKLSDLTDLGKKFIKAGIASKWMTSFDRPNSKKNFSNTDYLRKNLLKLREHS